MHRVNSASDSGHGHLEHVPVHDLRNRVVFVDEFVDNEEEQRQEEEQRGRGSSRDTSGTRRKSRQQATPHPKVKGGRGGASAGDGEDDGRSNSRRTARAPCLSSENRAVALLSACVNCVFLVI